MTNLLAISLIVSVAGLHQQAGTLLQHGQYAEAAVFCRSAVARFDASTLEAALLLRDLGLAYRGEGLLNKAEAARHQELEILRSQLGEEDGNVATALDGLGEIYYEQGRFSLARRTFEAALRTGERSLDPKSPQLATILNDLGAVYRYDGRIAEASNLLGRSLAIRESQIARENLRAVAKLQSPR